MDKSHARAAVWADLIHVARPDSRYHLDFNEYIPDFDGSTAATSRLTSMGVYKDSQALFITPDNCLEKLRGQVVLDNKTQVISTYGIRRGLVELHPDDVPKGMAQYAVLLDVIERLGRCISLHDLRERYRFDLIVTGASAVNYDGIRFGKGHGFFDLEWAMLYQLGVVEQSTPVVAFVHDCQLVNVELRANHFDTICDHIVTPTRTIQVADPHKPTAGVIWDKLEPSMLHDIASLHELKRMEEHGQTRTLANPNTPHYR